jgi:hypothetical protein
VHVELGPLPSASARVWLEYASVVLDEVDRTGGKVGDRSVAVAPDVLDAFRSYVASWTAAAGREPFRWSGDADPEMVEYLLHVWFKLAAALAERSARRGTTGIPEAGRHFYQALVVGLLDALAAEGREPLTAFAEELRAFWPGLDETSGA